MIRYYNGTASSEEAQKAHKLEYYNILDNVQQKKYATSTVITLERWNAILHICKQKRDGIRKSNFKFLQKNSKYS